MGGFLIVNPIPLFIIIAIIVVAIIVRIAQRGNVGKVIIGIILIIVAIGANIVASGLWTEGQKVWLIHNASKGQQMMAIADGIKYSGIALGILGLVLSLLPLFKQNSNNNVVSQSMPLQDNSFAHTMNKCSNCGAMNLVNAKYCYQCGTLLIPNQTTSS